MSVGERIATRILGMLSDILEVRQCNRCVDRGMKYLEERENGELSRHSLRIVPSMRSSPTDSGKDAVHALERVGTDRGSYQSTASCTSSGRNAGSSPTISYNIGSCTLSPSL